MLELAALACFAPLAGAAVVGLLRTRMPRAACHHIAVGGVVVSLLASCAAAWQVWQHGPFNENLYLWGTVGSVPLSVGFLLDNLTVLMMLVVTSVSLAVHIYTIGYMEKDPGYGRFFCYISLFTFAMMMLVTANNFLQLFFGWEAVGLASYLLIGFWFSRPSAVHANLKAFLVNRVGDLGFLVGIGVVLAHFGSLDYAEVFAAAPAAAEARLVIGGEGEGWHMMTVACIALFVGAMGKSAQMPLHVWLPDSMEGPTPISALIHAATMVTAGIFMVARMSPLFEYSEAALTFVLWAGALTAFFMGLLGLVQDDIKRVVAYSTLSQLGYMTAALGASAYGAAVFHLFTHAFFKALLFLAAGSVIIAMHHEQNMRKMGGLRVKMPVTYACAMLGTLALAGLPPFAGFYSKDAIMEAVRAAAVPGASAAFLLLLAGVFVTALYSFRLIFITFHGQPRMSDDAWAHAKESPKVVTAPLIALAIPSVVAGALFFNPMLMGDYFSGSILVLPEHDSLAPLRESAGDVWGMTTHGLVSPALWLAAAGAAAAWWLYIKKPESAAAWARGPWRGILARKYGFDDFNEAAWGRGAPALGGVLWRRVDAQGIDGLLAGAPSKWVTRGARWLRLLQTGYLYHYAFVMIAGAGAALLWLARG